MALAGPVRPYGDAPGDGAVQLSFTLPMAAGARATEAARTLARKMGFQQVDVVHTSDLGAGFTFFVLYGRGLGFGVAPDEIVLREPEREAWEPAEINERIRKHFERRLVVVGACIGSDTHTVGIDAILNLKGYKGHAGLEAYPEIDVHNLGSQVGSEELIERAIELAADAVLVSQIVTQKNLHLKTLTEFVELAEGFGVRDHTVLVAGGPGITNQLALELGFDGGFGRGTHASHVATFVIQKLIERGGASR